MSGWRPPRVLASFLAVYLLLIATSGLALAHANLVRSDPPANASLKTAPTTIQLWFSEDLEPSFSKIVVYDTNQQQVDRGDSHVAPNDPRSMIVTLKPNLPNGTYAIAWVTQSRVDGHIVRGIVPFGVGVASAPVTSATSEGVAAGAVSGSPLEMALRWLSLLSICALVGAFAFWILQDIALSRVDETSRVTTVLAGQIRLALGVWVLFLVSNIVLMLNQASLAVGVSLVGAIGAPLVQVVAQTHYGHLWIARMVLGTELGVIVLLRSDLLARSEDKASVVDRSSLAIGGLLLLSVSMSSHSAAIGSFTPLGVANDWLHLAAVAVWVGGLLQLAALAAAAPRARSLAERARSLSLVVPRFAVIAGIALGVLGATGLGEALIHVGTLDNLIGSGYGQALLVKILIILPLLAIAAINHFVIRPGFVAARQKQTSGALARARDAAAMLKWTVRVEVLLAVGVIAAAGVMTSLSPSQEFGSAIGGPLTLTAPAGDLQTSFTLSPGRPGPNQYAIDLRTASGQVAANVQQVSVRLTYLDSNLGVTEVALAPTGPGRFAGQSSDLAVAGRWQAEVSIRRSGQDDVTADYGFQVTANGAQSLQGAPLQLGWSFYAGLVIVLLGCLALARGIWMRRSFDVRRAAAVAACGICLGGIGGALAFRDVQQAQAQAAASTAALAHPPTAQSIANGAMVFRSNCAICHGVDARGDGPMAQTLSPPPSNLIVHVPLHPDADLEYWIANGFPGSAMPAFKDKLTDQQRWDVLNYLKSQVNAANGGPGSASASSPSATLAPAAAVTPTAPASGTPGAPTSVPSGALPPSPTAVPPSPTPTGGGLSQQRTIGDLSVAVQITPRIFDPADVEIRVTDPNGQPASDVTGVDLQVAMAGMDHGARGITATSVGPGRYRAKALLLVMQGPWLLAVRVERANAQPASTVFGFDVPRDNPRGAVSAMYERPSGPVQIEDVAVYPGEISPRRIAVQAKRPVQIEFFYVNRPDCGSTISFDQQDARTEVAPDGLATLSFVPDRSGQLDLSCQSTGLALSPSQ